MHFIQMRTFWLGPYLVAATTWLVVLGAIEASEVRYRAAVYEHAVVLPLPPASTRQGALRQMEKNLDVYHKQAASAKQQGAQLIVFPEDGLYGMLLSRDQIRSFLETVPDPLARHVNPCVEQLPLTEVQTALSCLARDLGIYLVANMGDRQPCNTSSNSTCPSDGQWQFNTAVAFGPDGQLLARYHKINLYGEPQFDTPPPDPYNNAVTFNTSFGVRFGLATCFDLLFRTPSVDLVERHGVRDLAFPTAWMDAPPLLPAVGFHSAFARGLGVTVLAANLHLPLANMHGSGIYTARGAAAFYYDSELLSTGRLVIADVLQDGGARMVLPEDWSGSRPDLPGRQSDSVTARPDFLGLLSNFPDRQPHFLGRQPDFSSRQPDFLNRHPDFSETDHGAKESNSIPRTWLVSGLLERADQAGDNSGYGSSLSNTSMHKQSSPSKETLITKLLRKGSSTSRKSFASLKYLRLTGRQGTNVAQKVIQETQQSSRIGRTDRLKRNTRSRELNARKERIWKADYRYKIVPFSTYRKEPLYLSDNFTFVLLNSTSGQRELCFQEFCCSIEYKFAETTKKTHISDLTSSSTAHKVSRDSSLASHSEESNSSGHKLKGSSALLWRAMSAKNQGPEKENQEWVDSMNLDSSGIQARKPGGRDLGEGDGELYALGVFSGYEGDIGTQRFVQVCLVTRCPKGTPDSCGQPVTTATRRMETLLLQGRFSTRHVFPEVLVLQGGQLSPAPGLWDYSAGTIMGSAKLSDSPLVAAALYGRWYERDHPPAS